jgi:hypothetical protein
MTDDPVKSPRFPFVAALLCAACLGAAVWTWMIYSYAWDVTPANVADDRFPDWAHRYVALRGDELLHGRVVEYPEGLAVDTTASRFHGASIAGLVVGAMGVFVFSVALRHWLGERRRFREGVGA